MSQVESPEQFTSVGLDGKISIHTRYEPPAQFKIKCSLCTDLLKVYPRLPMCNEYIELKLHNPKLQFEGSVMTLRVCESCESKLIRASYHTPVDVNKSVKFD